MTERRNLTHALVGGTNPPSILADFGLTVLRIFTGLSMALAHGLGKIQGPSPEFIAGVEAMGFPLPTASAWAAAITEFFGGLMLTAGLFTRLNAALLLFTMLVAGIGMHWWMKGDDYEEMEMALLYGAVAFAFMFTGAGRFSIDKMLR